jgi:hypothetical protein
VAGATTLVEVMGVVGGVRWQRGGGGAPPTCQAAAPRVEVRVPWVVGGGGGGTQATIECRRLAVGR